MAVSHDWLPELLLYNIYDIIYYVPLICFHTFNNFHYPCGRLKHTQYCMPITGLVHKSDYTYPVWLMLVDIQDEHYLSQIDVYL